MNKKEVLQKVNCWLELFSDEYDFNTRWYTHDNVYDLIADDANYASLIANKTAYLKKKDDRYKEVK